MIPSRTFAAVLAAVGLLLSPPAMTWASKVYQLPKPRYSGKMSVEAAMVAKKSVRSFKRAPLSMKQVSQVLWAANGMLPSDAITGATPKVIPSAGGLYPLEVFIVTGEGTVTDLPAGVYHYNAVENSLQSVASGEKRMLLAGAALSQTWLAAAPATIVIAGVFSRTTVKYGDRGNNYVFMEAGNSNQNVYLQCEALGLNTATIGAFNDAQVKQVLSLPPAISPLLLMPVGK